MSDLEYNVFVTERELRAHLDPIRSDLGEIKADVKLLLAPSPDAWLGARGRGVVTTVVTGLCMSLAAGAAGAAISLFLN